MVIEPMIHCLDESGTAIEFRSYSELLRVHLEEPTPELVQIDVDDQGNEIWGYV